MAPYRSDSVFQLQPYPPRLIDTHHRPPFSGSRFSSLSAVPPHFATHRAMFDANWGCIWLKSDSGPHFWVKFESLLSHLKSLWSWSLLGHFGSLSYEQAQVTTLGAQNYRSPPRQRARLLPTFRITIPSESLHACNYYFQIVMRCKMVTDRHQLFQNYLWGYRYSLKLFRN